MAQQPSIRSFFQPRQQPKYAAPPSATATPPNLDGDTRQTSQPPPPPPLPPSERHAASLVLPDLPVLAPPPSLPSQASIVPVAAAHIPALRRINSLLLPVAYPDSFYTKALDPLASGYLSRAILWQDDPSTEPKVIGGIVCRLEPNALLDATGQPRSVPLGPRTQQLVPPPDTPYHAIYIQSLALLSPYRSQGLAAAALEHIIACAALLSATTSSSPDVRTIYAHVWTENAEGLKWYEARGFRRESPEPLQGYYFKLRPDTAWVIQRDIGPGAPPPPPSGPSQWQAAWPTSSPPAAGVPAAGAPGANGSTVAAAVNLPPITRSSSTGPPPRQPSATPSSSVSSLSFQNARPETEWNDLPTDMVGAGPGRSQLLSPSSAPGSTASSRSSSAVRKKKDRAYPSGAFGS